MTTLTKIIVTMLLSLLFFSCNFDISMGIGVNGNGNIVTDERTINEPFTAIKASEGLNVYLTQSDYNGIIVEADENLQDLIITEVVDHVLKIHTRKNIGHASAKKVMVNFNDIDKISSSSGSNVHSTNTITTEHLALDSSSGSDMKLDIDTSVLTCKSSSGSDLRLSGETDKLMAEASSGSNIKAGDLMAQSSHVKASSGADITINTSKELVAEASSGGGIKYYGNPEKVDKHDSASGSIKKR